MLSGLESLWERSGDVGDIRCPPWEEESGVDVCGAFGAGFPFTSSK